MSSNNTRNLMEEATNKTLQELDEENNKLIQETRNSVWTITGTQDDKDKEQEKSRTKEVVLGKYFSREIDFNLLKLTRNLKGLNTYSYTVEDIEENDNDDELWLRNYNTRLLYKYIVTDKDFGSTYKGDLIKRCGETDIISTQLDDYREDKDFIEALKSNPEYLRHTFRIVEIPIDYNYVVVEEEWGSETMYAGKGLIVLK